MTLLVFPARLLDAVRATVAYADVFDFPLHRQEIQRDLIGLAVPGAATAEAIDALLRRRDLATDGSYLILPGRDGLARLRRDRGARAARLWPVARRFGRIIGQFPFVRLVALTGSLAAGNPDERADIDYLIIAAPGRLWSVRAMAVALVRVARHGGVHLCPNYLLTTRVLALDHQDLFTAHELLQATPLTGAATYRRLLGCNSWAARWLPNRYRQCRELPLSLPAGSPLQTFGEGALAGRLGRRFEQWEAQRKRQRLSHIGAGRFTADMCEGHFGHSRRQALGNFQQRCRQLGIVPPGVPGDRQDPASTSPRYHNRHAGTRTPYVPIRSASGDDAAGVLVAGQSRQGAR